MKLSTILLALLILLSGCQSVPPPPLAGANYGPHAATIIFLREDSPPKALGGLFSLDGVPRTKLSVNEYVAARCLPGRRELKFSFPLWVGVPSKKLVLDVAPSSTRYVLYSSSVYIAPSYPFATVGITPKLVELPQAEAEVLQARFTPQP